MPAAGSTYVRKPADYMARLLVRPCPRCGAKIGELCTFKSGKKATEVTEVHTARFLPVKRRGLIK